MKTLSDDSFELTATAKCEDCGASFVAQGIVWAGRPVYNTRCYSCYNKHQAAERAAELVRIHQGWFEDHWADLCPIEFRLRSENGGHTDLDRLRVEQPLLEEIMQWSFGPRGLLLHGPTGSCKTRIAWRLLRREFEQGRKVHALKAASVGMESHRHALEGDLEKWFSRLVEPDVLLIDDLGKGRFTDSAEAHIFNVVDQRTEQGRPLIITTNETRSSLTKRMTSARCEPFLRRLRDYCDTFALEPSEG
ncbi:MAG: ATP-binding protein [Verrucomicrobiia bacterium]